MEMINVNNVHQVQLVLNLVLVDVSLVHVAIHHLMIQQHAIYVLHLNFQMVMVFVNCVQLVQFQQQVVVVNVSIAHLVLKQMVPILHA